MKKVLALVLILVLCFSLMGVMSGCKETAKEDTNNLSTEAKKIKVWLMTEKKIYDEMETYEYDNNGRITKFNIGDDAVAEFKYTDKGVSKIIVTEYDDEPYEILCECDAKGNIIKCTSDIAPNDYINVIYDSNDNIVRIEKMDGDDNEITTTNYEYDDKGNVINAVKAQDGETLETLKISYTYDEQDRIIKKDYKYLSDYIDGGHWEVSDCDFKYDKNGNLLSYSGDNGVVKEEYKYIEVSVPVESANRLKKQADIITKIFN